MKLPILSICTGMGLFDRAFLDAGFTVVPGCEIDQDQRGLYRQLCGDVPLYLDIVQLIAWLTKTDTRFVGVIGGPPCQSNTKLRAIRKPKYPDLTPEVKQILDLTKPGWFLFENVVPLDIPGAKHIKLDAMHFAKPHQSRPRWFTYSPSLTPPKPIYIGTVDDLLAYSVVAGRIYGPKRAAILQGYPLAAGLEGSSAVLQKGIANAVHYDLARAWTAAIKRSVPA